MTLEKDRLATAQWIFERQLAWIVAADTKIAAVVALDTGLLAGIAAAYSASTEAARTDWTFAWAIVAGTFALLSLGCAAVALHPRTSGPISSLLYFGRISELTLPDYRQKLQSTSDGELLDDWATQIHRNSEIATFKYKWVARCINWAFLAATPWLIAVIKFVRP